VDVRKLAKEKWKVRRGYSSGASSHGTEDDNHTAIDPEQISTGPPKLDLPPMPRPSKPIHREISEGSCLTELKETFGKDGELAKTVVRIEVLYSDGYY
jgi:hypothetical protein